MQATSSVRTSVILVESVLWSIFFFFCFFCLFFPFFLSPFFLASLSSIRRWSLILRDDEGQSEWV